MSRAVFSLESLKPLVHSGSVPLVKQNILCLPKLFFFLKKRRVTRAVFAAKLIRRVEFQMLVLFYLLSNSILHMFLVLITFFRFFGIFRGILVTRIFQTLFLVQLHRFTHVLKLVIIYSALSLVVVWRASRVLIHQLFASIFIFFSPIFLSLIFRQSNLPLSPIFF